METDFGRQQDDALTTRLIAEWAYQQLTMDVPIEEQHCDIGFAGENTMAVIKHAIDNEIDVKTAEADL